MIRGRDFTIRLGKFPSILGYSSTPSGPHCRAGTMTMERVSWRHFLGRSRDPIFVGDFHHSFFSQNVVFCVVVCDWWLIISSNIGWTQSATFCSDKCLYLHGRSPSCDAGNSIKSFLFISWCSQFPEDVLVNSCCRRSGVSNKPNNSYVVVGLLLLEHLATAVISGSYLGEDALVPFPLFRLLVMFMSCWKPLLALNSLYLIIIFCLDVILKCQNIKIPLAAQKLSTPFQYTALPVVPFGPFNPHLPAWMLRIIIPTP